MLCLFQACHRALRQHFSVGRKLAHLLVCCCSFKQNVFKHSYKTVLTLSWTQLIRHVRCRITSQASGVVFVYSCVWGGKHMCCPASHLLPCQTVTVNQRQDMDRGEDQETPWMLTCLLNERKRNATGLLLLPFIHCFLNVLLIYNVT